MGQKSSNSKKEKSSVANIKPPINTSEWLTEKVSLGQPSKSEPLLTDKIKIMDNSLAKYYKQFDKNYFNIGGVGKFAEFCEECGLVDDDLEAEMDLTDPEDSIFIDFDDEFPLQSSVNDYKSEQHAIYYILQNIYNGDTDSIMMSHPKPLQVNVFFWQLPDEKKDIENMKRVYRTQCPNLSVCCNRDISMIKLLAIGHQNKVPYLQFLSDMYLRDRIIHRMQTKNEYQKDLSVYQWSEQNKHFQLLKKLRYRLIALNKFSKRKCLNYLVNGYMNRNFLNNSNINYPVELTNICMKYIGLNIFDKFQNNHVDEARSALHEWTRRICPKLTFSPTAKIYYSLPQICVEIIAIIDFVHILAETKPFPFQIDIGFIFNETKLYSLFRSEISSSDDDDDDDDDDEDADCFGNIKEKLRKEKLIYTTYDNCKTEMLSKILSDGFNTFKDDISKKKYYSQYPKGKRFCVIIDKRKPNKDDIGINEQDEIIYFEPPNDCNMIPETNPVSEWYFNATMTCIIPNIGYNHGNEKNCNYNYNAGVITSNTLRNYNSKMMMFSFHAESADTIRCYMHLNGTTRFYPMDIIHILPLYFDKNYGSNKYFGSSCKTTHVFKELKELKAKLPDAMFEMFYNEYGMKDTT